MKPEELVDFKAGLRSLPTSRLIIMMNVDALVDVFRSSPEIGADDRKRVIEAIANEIDRRVPVPE